MSIMSIFKRKSKLCSCGRSGYVKDRKTDTIYCEQCFRIREGKEANKILEETRFRNETQWYG